MRAVIILILGFFPSFAFSSELSTLTSQLQIVMHNKLQLSNDVKEAKERTVLCEYCHGRDGISNRPYIPNLAGQYPTYLLKQLLHFADGKRKSDVMQPLAKDLTKADMINIAIYYAKMPAPNRQNDTQIYNGRDAVVGRAIYRSKCARCHGATAEGGNIFPRLAGQKIEYVVNTLKMFAAPKIDENNPLLFDAERSNPAMVDIVRQLKPKDMRAVANFIASLQ